MLPAGLELSVHDEITVGVDGSVTIVRKYLFRNGTTEQVSFRWKGQDYVPSSTATIDVEPPAVAIGVSSEAAPVLEWDLPDTELEADGAKSISVTLSCNKLLQRDPAKLSLRYHSAIGCNYSFALKSPLNCLLEPDDCVAEGTSTVGEIRLIRGHDGPIRNEHPIRVSASAGPCILTIEPKRPQPLTIPLVQYYSTGTAVSELPLNGHVVLLIPHLLGDSLAYLQSLCAAGMDPDRAFIVGIPYSTKESVARDLWRMGFRNIEMPTSYPFNDAVERALRKALELCRRENRKLIIVEDGGYAGPLLHQQFASDLSLCLGIVEQTRNGIWQYDECKVDLKVPLLNVADSKLKIDRESPLIGRAVYFNIQALVRQLGKDIDKYKALVVGFGATGSHVAAALRNAGVDVVVYDQIPERRTQAEQQGFRTHDSLGSLVTDRDLIIGCTGKEPFQFAEILAIPHQAVFVNASSKRRELNYDDLDRMSAPNSHVERIAGVGHRRRLTNGKDLILLADGYPVNFVGDSVPNHEIAFILVLLQQCAILIATKTGELAIGLIPVPDELQRQIESRHDGFLGRTAQTPEPAAVPSVSWPQRAWNTLCRWCGLG